MDIGAMVDESSPESSESLVRPPGITKCILTLPGQTSYLTSVASKPCHRRFPDSSSGAEAYAEKDKMSSEVTRLKDAFKGMTLRANAKVTPERVYSMVVHPEPTKTLAFVGDKYGMIGMWVSLLSRRSN